MSLQFLSFSGVSLQADIVLNARPIYRRINQVIVTFRKVAMLKVSAAYQARPIGSEPSRHMQAPDRAALHLLED